MISRLAFALFLTLFLAQSIQAKDAPRLIAPLLINGQARGEVWTYPNSKEDEFFLESEKTLKILSEFLTPEKLERLSHQSKENLISLYRLQQVGIRAIFDEQLLETRITIPLSMITPQSLSLHGDRGPGHNLKELDPYSGYFNLYFTHSQSHSLSLSTSNLARVELFQQLGPFVLESNATHDTTLNKTRRHDTRMIYDLEKNQIRWTLGDLNYRTRGFQNYIPMTGLSLKKQFNLDPKGGPRSINSTQIELNEASLVEVYLKESLIYKKFLPVGVFDLKEIPMYPGPNLIRLKFTNLMGQVQWIEKNLLFDTQILAQGTHEFSYNLGYLISSTFPDYSYDTSRSVSSLYHLYGLSHQINIGFNFQNSQDHSLAGLDSDFLFNFGSGSMSFAQSFSPRPEHVGRAAEFTLRTFELIENPDLRLSFQMQRNEASFSASSSGPGIYEGYEEIQALLGLSSDSYFNLSRTDWHSFLAGQDLVTHRLGYNMRLKKEWRLGLNAESRSDQTPSPYYFFTISWTEAAGKYSSHFQHDHLNSTQQISFQKNSRGTPWDWSAAASLQKEDDGNFYELQAERYTPWGNLRAAAQHSTVSASSYLTLNSSSSVAWSRGRLAFGKPITDGFVILSGENIPAPNTVIISGDKYIEDDSTHSIKRGDHYLVHDLNSYQPRTLRLISQQATYSYLMTEDFVSFFPRYRQGGLYAFNFKKQMIIKGSLLISPETPLSYESGEIYSDKGQLVSADFFTNSTGNFVLMGLGPGQYTIKLASPELENVSLTISESNDDSIEVPPIFVKNKQGI